MELYLEVKGQDKDKVFKRTTERNIGYLKSSLGLRTLEQYSTADASTFRQWLLERNLSPVTLSKVFSCIKAVINFTIKEKGLDVKNNFAGIYLPKSEARNKRHPISSLSQEVRSVQLALTGYRKILMMLFRHLYLTMIKKTLRKSR